MTFQGILDEEFAEYNKDNDETIGIWKNPTRNDLRDLIKETKPKYGLRFFVDTEKDDVYVFDSNLLHSDASRTLFGKNLGRRLARGYADLDGKIEKEWVEDYLFLNRTDKEKQDILKAIKKGGLTL